MLRDGKLVTMMIVILVDVVMMSMKMRVMIMKCVMKTENRYYADGNDRTFVILMVKLKILWVLASGLPTSVLCVNQTSLCSHQIRFQHARKIELEPAPENLTVLKEALSSVLKERVGRVYYLDSKIKFLVPHDLSNPSHSSRLSLSASATCRTLASCRQILPLAR